MQEYSIGKRVVEVYLHQPYSWFLSRHSADFGKAILSEIQQIIEIGINPITKEKEHLGYKWLKPEELESQCLDYLKPSINWARKYLGDI